MAKTTSKKSAKVAKEAARGAANPALLAGGNPQIAKADGDAPVQAYIAAMPGWKREVGRRPSTRSSRAPSPACARPSNGTRRCTGSRAKEKERPGSSASTASRNT